jgi:hypothetical protein
MKMVEEKNSEEGNDDTFIECKHIVAVGQQNIHKRIRFFSYLVGNEMKS